MHPRLDITHKRHIEELKNTKTNMQNKNKKQQE